MATITKRRKLNHPPTAANGHLPQNGSVVTNGTHNGLSKPKEDSTSVTVTEIFQVFLPTFTLIFGGCCSNVYALESLIHTSPTSGTLLTALQFLVISLITLPANLSSSSSRRSPLNLRPRLIPLREHGIYTAFFLTINILNNCAFGYRISIPLHIILRSAGPVTTMGVFYFWEGRRYPPGKIFAVMLLFVGVMVAAAADAYSKMPEATISTLETETQPSGWLHLPSSRALRAQGPGFLLLASALVLSAFMGLYADKLYGTYGRSAAITSESLFYSHALSLPFFALQPRTLAREWGALTGNSLPLGQTLATASNLPKLPLSSALQSIPTAIPMLFLNAIMQYVCIKGVNQLSAKSSSLTVSIVLNVRKLVSLLLSIWLFGNQLPLGVIAGAVLVFAGGALYAVPSGSKKTDAAPRKKEL